MRPAFTVMGVWSLVAQIARTEYQNGKLKKVGLAPAIWAWA